ncbi:uncharacterized protein RAG0_02896 [Rhynchosporium agropyri]|uniref:Uncharacterized protein n=1 Tax=Rhynchosporium agropyri TaxID=914238 RepID=A0A1E1K349_9HELO|nr:uncharacterized protein RAG0_02896 [Rhynchosporium agropyri]
MALLKKTFSVLGSGKATALASLLFKFDGIDMISMDEFDREGIKQHDQVINCLKRRGRQLVLKTPNYFLAESDSPNVDCVILVINADSANTNLSKVLSEAAEYSENIIVLVDKMDEVGWSEEVFRATVKRLGPAAEGISAIPFSSSTGDNTVELSSNSSWHTDPTLLEALEARFSSS